MLLLDDDQPIEEDLKKKSEEAPINRKRGLSFRPPVPNQKKGSLDRSYQKSMERKKSIENGITLPNIANKKSVPLK